jgi:5-methylcytosine-specific restriction endonuclease McrA
MDKVIVLKLNANWQPVGFASVRKTIIDLCAGINCYAVNVDYHKNDDGSPDFAHVVSMSPTTWDDWIKLPVRPWDLAIHSPHLEVRVPTVLIAKNYSKMPLKKFAGKPSKKSVWERDKGVDQYTGKSLKSDEASIDHILPKSRGGDSTWENVVLTHKNLNHKKGNKLNHEVGLKLIRKPKAPPPVPFYTLIREIKHADWVHFLKIYGVF